MTLGIAEVPKSMVHVAAIATSAAVMGLCVFLAKQSRARLDA